MKRLLLIPLLSLLPLAIYAVELTDKDPLKVQHSIGLAGNIGYSSFFYSQKGSPLGLVGGGLDLVYQLDYGHFIFQTGLGIQNLNSVYSWMPLQESFTITDAGFIEGKSAEWVCDLYPLREKLISGYATLPVLFGGKWDKYYFLAGANVGVNIFGKAYNTGTQTTTIHTDFLEDDLTDMPNHALMQTPVRQSQKISMRTNVALQAEIGMDLDTWLAYKPKRKTRRKTFREYIHYRASIVASYGLLNVAEQSDRPFLQFQPQEGPALNAYAASDNATVHPFYIGVKFTVLYTFEPPKKRINRKPVARTMTSRPKQRTKPKSQKQKPIEEKKEIMLFAEQTVEQGDTIILENLFFATDATDILPASEPTLQTLSDFLQTNLTVTIQIVGHTDNTGSIMHNQELSLRRAQSVMQTLIDRGIDPTRLSAEGRSSTEPIADNNTPEGRAENRRVEIVINKTH